MLGNEFAVKVRSKAYVAMPKLIADHLQVGCLKQFIDSECMPQLVRVDAGEFLFKPITLNRIPYFPCFENMPPLKKFGNACANASKF